MGDTNSLRQKPPIAADRTVFTECGPLRLPADLRQWFPEDRLLGWIDQALPTLHKEHPELAEALQHVTTGRANALLSVIVLGCVTGTFTSEDIARACQSQKPFIHYCGGEAPFRQDLEQFRRKNRVVLEHTLAAVLLSAVKERYSKLDKLPPGLEFSVLHRAVDRLDTARHMDTWDE